MSKFMGGKKAKQVERMAEKKSTSFVAHFSSLNVWILNKELKYGLC